MIPYERQEKILEVLSENELLRIEDLQTYIPDTSISTLRRDLKELSKLNKVQLLTGGAVKIYSTVSELPIVTKAVLQTKEKRYIAKLAQQQVMDGETIYLDSGSTCTTLLEELLNREIHIVTTNTDIFGLSRTIKAEITTLGGSYNPNISSLSGPLTIENLSNFIFDKAFLGANGIDIMHGITTPNLLEATKKRAVLANSKKSFLLCDSSKFHKISAVRAFDLNSVTLITDKSDQQIEEKMQVIYKKGQ
ncbi:DeoR/GlpR family DNA-binding transcription regulator [Enterococcus sp. LJL99]